MRRSYGHQLTGWVLTGCSLSLVACEKAECKRGLIEAGKLEQNEKFADGHLLLSGLAITHDCSSPEFRAKQTALELAEKAEGKRVAEERARQREEQKVAAVEQFEDFCPG